MHKEVRQLIKECESHGLVITPTKSGHYRVACPKTGATITTLPSTPSDHRSMRNTRGDIKRFGIPLAHQKLKH